MREHFALVKVQQRAFKAKERAELVREHKDLWKQMAQFSPEARNQGGTIGADDGELYEQSIDKHPTALPRECNEDYLK